jgi:hypothetical protein
MNNLRKQLQRQVSTFEAARRILKDTLEVSTPSTPDDMTMQDVADLLSKLTIVLRAENALLDNFLEDLKGI